MFVMFDFALSKFCCKKLLGKKFDWKANKRNPKTSGLQHSSSWPFLLCNSLRITYENDTLLYWWLMKWQIIASSLEIESKLITWIQFTRNLLVLTVIFMWYDNELKDYVIL